MAFDMQWRVSILIGNVKYTVALDMQSFLAALKLFVIALAKVEYNIK